MLKILLPYSRPSMGCFAVDYYLESVMIPLERFCSLLADNDSFPLRWDMVRVFLCAGWRLGVDIFYSFWSGDCDSLDLDLILILDFTRAAPRCFLGNLYALSCDLSYLASIFF